MIHKVTPYIYSQLGSNGLLPLALKDVANSSGMTLGSYITGDKLEGKDRFIDEFVSRAIWLFGVPFFKKALDLTLFKAMGYDPKVDVRNLQNKDILKTAIEKAPKNFGKAIEKVEKNASMFKALNMAKFLLSAGLTIGAYFALTKFRHKHTEESAKKNILEEKANQKSTLEQNKAHFFGNRPTFESFQGKNPSFTGVQGIMLNPMKNLMFVDGAITAERLSEARSPQDFLGYAIKEGGFWGFVYYASDYLKGKFEAAAEKKHNKSIDLDARVIESKRLKNALGTEKLVKDLVDFPDFDPGLMKKNLSGDELKKLHAEDFKIYKWLHANEENIVIKMAEKSGIIPRVKLEDGQKVIDTRKFVDMNELKGIKIKLEKLNKQLVESGEPIEKFLSKVKNLKRVNTLKNIGTCVGALGILVPGIMVLVRKLSKNNQEFEVKKRMEEQLKAEGKI